jgi:ADP-heptose:LPS heptosyltransferase
LLITIDTAAAHLAGALGRPVWVLLRDAPDWRWLLGRSDSLWYPTMKLFRQMRPRDWSGPLEQVHRELKDLAGGRGGQPG